jgi:hypothetical protein
MALIHSIACRRQAQPICAPFHHRLDQDHAPIRRRLLRLAIGQCRLTEGDGAFERAHLRCKPLHARIGHAGKLVRQQLRRGQKIAQVVIDLRDRKAERREMAFLMQHRDKVALHVRQFALRHADFVGALRRLDDARGAFRILVKRHEICGDAPHRPHEQ